MTLLNGAPAYKHLLLHENKIDQDRMIPLKFQSCGKCRLHVPSIKDHLQRDHFTPAHRKKTSLLLCFFCTRMFLSLSLPDEIDHESEWYDDSTMDTPRTIHEKTPAGRFLAATKSG